MTHELRDSVRLGYLHVPQDHADPTGPTLRMAFAIVPASSPNPAPDPVVFIVGGPGLSGIDPHFSNRLRGTTTLLAIVLVMVLLGGGGFFYRRPV